MGIWHHIDANRPHLAYTILGGFTTLFMLVSLFVKEKLYIGEATVATICGIIFGPYGAGAFDPTSWGNVDQITLECSRIVLVVQCFAVGVELPKKYMNRHWKSVVFLLLPVMTWGWLVTSLFIWWLIPTLSWLESLACAACVTATDPVLASSVVGKGKFAKRVPKHLRDLLSAESGCNDGMAFPFIYLALQLIHHLRHSDSAAPAIRDWFLITILYECLFGAIYGLIVGYIGRRAIRAAESKGLIDRESFLVFYFVLALFCAGTGSMLGLDDLLVGFCAGVGFSNDGWFSSKTEESHVSNVIDLLLNLAYFVYFGAVIPWKQFNAPEWGLQPWRLVVLAIMVLLFRRIPIMVALKPFIPDIKTWRESVFAGHFGPIGVGAIFVAILARGELEHGEPTPLAVLPPKGSENYVLIEVIWPITTFLVITSIIVHGSSVAVFTLGKRINTMTISMSYTVGTEENGWLNRLPKLQNRTPSQSFRKAELEREGESDETLAQELDALSPTVDRSGTDPLTGEGMRRRRDGLGRGTGVPADLPELHQDKSPIDREKSWGIEAFQEGNQIILEDETGNVLGTVNDMGTGEKGQIHQMADDAMDRVHSHTRGRGHRKDGHDDDQVSPGGSRRVSPNPGPAKPSPAFKKPSTPVSPPADLPLVSEVEAGNKPPRKRSVANAFRIDDTVILEDEDGEVIKRYRIPKAKPRERRPASSFMPKESKNMWTKASKFFGVGEGSSKSKASGEKVPLEQDLERADTDVYPMSEYDYDGVISEASDDETSGGKKSRRFRIHDSEGRSLSTREMVERLKRFDAHSRETPSSSADPTNKNTKKNIGKPIVPKSITRERDELPESPAQPRLPGGAENPLKLQPIRGDVPIMSHPAGPSERVDEEETSAERKRREAALGIHDDEETAAEKRRREAALGIREEEEDDDADNEDERPRRPVRQSIRFAEHVKGTDSKGKGRA